MTPGPCTSQLDQYQLYVAKHPQTGLFLTRARGFLMDSQMWIEAKKPTDAEVAAELAAADQRRSMWTEDMNNAELWDARDIAEFGKFLPPVEFVSVRITTTSPEDAGAN